ncbi:transcription-repair coupling factor [Candidatus Cloacimonadota bacterium]
MFYKRLKPFLDRSEFIAKFDARCNSIPVKTAINNLNQSAKSVLMARALEITGKSIIMISADDKMAEEFVDDLDLLVGADRSFYLPDFEVLPYEERSPHYIIRAQRIESLARAVTGEPAVYNLSLRSFLRKIVHPDIFSKHVIALKKGEEYDPQLLISNLVGMGYDNEYQVSKVGDVARRGGIIDVFSPSTSRPVRIEFFGDEIESIRIFSISSQLSSGEELKSVVLLPSREFSLHDIDTSDILWDKIHKDGFYEGIESDVSLLLPKTGTFLDFFQAENCLIFWDNFSYFNSNIREILEETTDLYEKALNRSKNKSLPHPSELFQNKRYINKINQKYDHFYVSTGHQEIKNIEYSLNSTFLSQNNLHGKLEDLEEDLKAKTAENYRIIIQSDNSSQSKRMRDLLPQYEEQLDFTIGVLQKGFILTDARIAVYTDHEIFSRYKRKRRQIKFSKDEVLVDYESLRPGDYIVHIDHGIGIYGGLKQLVVDGNTIECLTLNYAGNDSVYVPTYQLSLVSKFISQEGIAPTVHKLGGKRWEQVKSRAKKQLELVAEDLIKLYAERKVKKGIAFDPDGLWQKEMEDSFIYEDTPDQRRATTEIKEDMEDGSPMERLLCGDVGFGKTEVAIRAAFKAVLSGWQVAVLVPTTLLAEQHYLVFRERLAQYPVRISMFSRFRSASQLKKDVLKLNNGEIDIAIGTHRLISKDVVFKRLGLLVIDEEHRFGVRHKEKLRKLKANVDTLYMSATPIPRTMNMALSKLKELSLIRTSPKSRLPIRTVIVPYDKDVIKDAVTREVDRGGQVFFVHNRIQTIDSIATELKALLPGVRFAVGHGQLPEKILERITLDFADHQFDVLISTTIIESGIDIPNVNTIIINRADMFGLSQLYQIRGRVGRSSRRAYAYLIIPPKFTEEARQRLETLIEYESLGSGYQIAMRDMELRGAGALLGTKQSGIINTIGFNYYNRLLDKAIKSIQENKPLPESEQDDPSRAKRLQIESDFYFPETYIADEKERLNIYRKMLQLSSEDQFDLLESELTDRFGEIPDKAWNALLYYRLNMLIKAAGLESFSIKKKSAVAEFNNQKLPARDKLMAMIKEIDLPVNLDGTGNMKIRFNIDIENKLSQNQIYEVCLKIVRTILNRLYPAHSITGID